jgi:hypothetical protein
MAEIKRFMFKVVQQSGLSQTGTYLPAGINPMLTTAPKDDINACMEEAEMVMGGAVKELLERTGEQRSNIRSACCVAIDSPAGHCLCACYFAAKPPARMPCCYAYSCMQALHTAP